MAHSLQAYEYINVFTTAVRALFLYLKSHILHSSSNNLLYFYYVRTGMRCKEQGGLRFAGGCVRTPRSLEEGWNKIRSGQSIWCNERLENAKSSFVLGKKSGHDVVRLLKGKKKVIFTAAITPSYHYSITEHGMAPVVMLRPAPH